MELTCKGVITRYGPDINLILTHSYMSFLIVCDDQKYFSNLICLVWSSMIADEDGLEEY